MSSDCQQLLQNSPREQPRIEQIQTDDSTTQRLNSHKCSSHRSFGSVCCLSLNYVNAAAPPVIGLSHTNTHILSSHQIFPIPISIGSVGSFAVPKTNSNSATSRGDQRKRRDNIWTVSVQYILVVVWLVVYGLKRYHRMCKHIFVEKMEAYFAFLDPYVLSSNPLGISLSRIANQSERKLSIQIYVYIVQSCYMVSIRGNCDVRKRCFQF